MQSKRLLYLQENYAKKFEKVNTYFTHIIKYDPTSIVSGETVNDIKKVGKYTQWLFNQFIKESNESVFLNKLSDIKKNLNKFDRFKQNLSKKDINLISINELEKLTKNINNKPTITCKSKNRNSKKIKKVYEDDRWLIIVPLTYDASKKLAKHPLTKWCTAARLRYFKEYSEKGDLYILLDKHQKIFINGNLRPKPTYQFHFKTKLFLDAKDETFDLVEFLLVNPGIAKYFKSNFVKLVRFSYGNLEMLSLYKKIYSTDIVFHKLVNETFKYIFEDKIDIRISDTSKNFIELISLIGAYDLFLDKIFKFLPQNMEHLEVKMNFYNGNGFEIIDSKLPKNLKFLCLEGFLKKIPEKLSELRKLSLISFANSQINAIPSDIYKLKRLELFDLSNTNVKEIKNKTNFIIFY